MSLQHAGGGTQGSDNQTAGGFRTGPPLRDSRGVQLTRARGDFNSGRTSSNSPSKPTQTIFAARKSLWLPYQTLLQVDKGKPLGKVSLALDRVARGTIDYNLPLRGGEEEGRLAFSIRMDHVVDFTIGVQRVGARLDSELSSPFYAFQLTVFVSSKE